MFKYIKKNKFIRKIFIKFFHPHKVSLDELNLYEIEKYHQKTIEILKSKKVLIVHFFISTATKWKYEYIYQMMLKDDMFLPQIVVVPIFAWDKEFMVEEMNKTYDWFNSRGYRVIKTYDDVNNKFLDIKKSMKPDIIFYSEPYNFIGKKYFITNFYKNTLCCYSQYAVMTSKTWEPFFNLPFHNLIWKFFVETDLHKKFSLEHSLNKGSNVVVTGHPYCEVLFKHKSKLNDTLKEDAKNKIKIIWAPHHSIDETYGSSNFLDIYDDMLLIAKKYSKKCFFIFKPHPNLKPRLYNRQDWGKDRTDEYYDVWKRLNNTQLWEKNYEDLFVQSDALIHDCGSFIVEYICINKPVLFVYKSDKVIEEKNDFGLNALNVSYKAYSVKEIERFITDIVLNKNDYKMQERIHFLKKMGMYKFDSPSVNIIKEIKRTIWGI